MDQESKMVELWVSTYVNFAAAYYIPIEREIGDSVVSNFALSYLGDLFWNCPYTTVYHRYRLNGTKISNSVTSPLPENQCFYRLCINFHATQIHKVT